MHPHRSNGGVGGPVALGAAAVLVIGFLAAACSPSGPAARAGGSSGRPTTGRGKTSAAASPVAPAPKPDRANLGILLSGRGAHLRPPTSPTSVAYTANCQQLVDPGFVGRCVIATGRAGTVAGVVEQEAAVLSQRAAAGAQERDLVWHRNGSHWDLADVHTFQNNGLESLVWADDLTRDHDPKLVFVTLTDDPNFGNELDVVEGTGKVTLYRYLGEGFAVVPATGGLVTYVPGLTEAKPAPGTYFDQVFIGYDNGSWRVFSEQYVPYAAALAQHHGAFWDPEATPGS